MDGFAVPVLSMVSDKTCPALVSSKLTNGRLTDMKYALHSTPPTAAAAAGAGCGRFIIVHSAITSQWLPVEGVVMDCGVYGQSHYR